MAKAQEPLEALLKYLPNGSFEEVLHYLKQYSIQLTITKKRQTILGDYRHAHRDKGHRISVNGDLNKYSFLITLLHEIAHLLTFEIFGNRVQPHGEQWKKEFSNLLARFLSKNIFPTDIANALFNSLKSPAASSCGDINLLRVLRNYDTIKPSNNFIVEALPANSLFSIKGERVFRKGEKIRTRYKCQEIATGKWYLFSGLFEVKKLAL